MYLPKNPEMLLSVINTALRDKYPSLAEMCTEEDVNEEEILSILENAGYYYNENLNAFKARKG